MRGVLSAWGILLACACAPSPTAPYYRQCTFGSCPPGWHCSLGQFCTRYCQTDDECTSELGEATYCAGAHECWRACSADVPSCPGATTCDLGACLYAPDSGVAGDR